MVRTTWLRERRVEEFEDALGRLEGKRPSAMDADAAYSSRATRDKLARLGIADSVQRKGYRNHPSSAADKRRNAGIAVVRLGVERTFAVYKRCYGLGRTRFVGLAKNLTFYSLAAIAHNIRKGARFPGLYGVAEPACGKQGASAQAAGSGTGAAPGIAPAGPARHARFNGVGLGTLYAVHRYSFGPGRVVRAAKPAGGVARGLRVVGHEK